MNFSYFISKFIKKLHISSIKNTNINKHSKIASNSQVINCELDKFSYIGNNCTVLHTKIGSFCSIADNCIIGGASHPQTWVSTSPAFHNGKNILNYNFSKHPYNPMKETIIGNDVWIGNNVLIKSGVRISDGAIIGMGSILTKDVGPYEIWAGNPAKLIRKRFDDNKIKKLLEIKWWNWTDEEIQQIASEFNNVEIFIKNRKII